MKKFLHLLAIVVVLAVGVTGCKKKPVGVTPIPGKSQSGIGGPGTGGLPIGVPTTGSEIPNESPFAPGTVAASTTAMNAGPQDREKLKAETVYFDVDSATIKNSEKSKLQKVADYLKANPTHDVLIEGHCDERGTEQYNLSLGEKRAQAVREHLVSLGAPADALYTQSYGEAHPASEGTGEAAWSKNRRAEFVVALPAGQ